MADANEVRFPMRVWINRENYKVIFAEIGGDLADILIGFLTLPLGTIVRLLVKQYGDKAPVTGSLNTLYRSLENLDVSHFWRKEGKLMLLNARNPFDDHVHNLKVRIDSTEPDKYFICKNQNCTLSKPTINISMYYVTKCDCGSAIDNEIKLKSRYSKVSSGVFTEECGLFIITDEMQVFANTVGTGLQIFNKHGIEGTYGIEEKNVTIGFEEIVDLLKGSLISRTPLTDFVLKRTSLTVTYTPASGVSAKSSTTSISCKKMTVKAIMQKSTGIILLAQTDEDFVDFLFSILSLPLGTTFSLLGGDVSGLSIHNIYSSLESLNGNRFLKIQDPFKKHEVPPKYLSKYQVFPITEQTTPDWSYGYQNNKGVISVYSTATNTTGEKGVVITDPKGHEECYVKGPAMFIITDDLVVRPTSQVSAFSILNTLRIPMSDIEEHAIDIGMDEALSILRAILFSTSALSNSLKNFLMKQPKIEK